MARPWPKWLDDLMVREYAEQFAPRPSMSEIAARTGANQPRESVEDFLRRMSRDELQAEQAVANSVDADYAPGTNIFGGPVKTLDQSRAMSRRNLPGIENLPPEDQIALARALEQGDILRSMQAVGSVPVSRFLPGQMARSVEPSHRISAETLSEHPLSGFIPSTPPTMAQVMRSLGSKRQYQRFGGSADRADLPHPPVFGGDTGRGPMRRDPFTNEVVVNEAAEALGPDIPELARRIRQDQIDSRTLTLRELIDEQRQQELMDTYGQSLAAEARATEYGGFPPETVSQMDKATRSRQSLERGSTERLTQDPLHTIARRALEVDPGTDDWDATQSFADWSARTDGKTILQGFAAGQALGLPITYGIIRYTHPHLFDEDGMPKLPGSTPQAPYEPPQQLADLAEEEEMAYRARPENVTFDPPPIELPDMPLITMPMDEVGILDEPVEDMTFLDEGVDGAPAMDELDSELVAAGLQPAATNRRDIDSMSVGGRRVDSLYPPESVEYQMEQAYKRRTGKRPYPSLRY